MNASDVGTYPEQLSPHPRNNTQDLSNALWDKQSRIIALWVQIVVGTIGGFMVCTWLWCNRGRKSRVNVIMLHVTLSDLLVMVATLVQVIWEMADRWWLAGDAMCRIVKFYQTFSMMSSSNMLVLLSIDRHQAIRSPLRAPPEVWKMALPCWSLAALLSTPMFFMYRVTFMQDEENQFFNMTICESIFRVKPPIHRTIFTTSMGVIHIFIPCIIIAICYVRMFLKIAQKANMNRSSNRAKKSQKFHIQSTRSTAFPKARIKTLKMTVVIVSMFIICGLPYHILELFYNFWDYHKVPKMASAILGALPVLNSVINPYVFLLFNANYCCREGSVHQQSQAGSKADPHHPTKNCVGNSSTCPKNMNKNKSHSHSKGVDNEKCINDNQSSMASVKYADVDFADSLKNVKKGNAYIAMKKMDGH